MSTLRVLLVEHDPGESQRISSALLDANHAVIPTSGLDEASEALLIQKFDAILLGSLPAGNNVAAFATQVRNLGMRQESGMKAPLISCSGQTADHSLNGAIDAYLPQRFEPAAFMQAMESLMNNLPNDADSLREGASGDLPILETEEFRAQVAYDDDLMVEIIDLFLAECTGQVVEMRTALSAGDFNQLTRVAHTIKGSLGSLHAMRAKSDAQELEFAAKGQDISACASSLMALESALATLKPLLLSLRVTASSR